MPTAQTLDTFFERTLIINLPDRDDRRRETRRSLGRHGIEMRAGKVEFFEATRMPDRGSFPTRGAHGCYHSHLGALQRARDEGWANVCIMEDDVHPLPVLAEAGPVLLEDLGRREWDVALLGWIRPDHAKVIHEGSPEWKSMNEPFIGLHAYAVNQRAYDRLIEAIERHGTGKPTGPNGRRWHVDEMFWVAAGEGSLNILAALPVMFGQRSSRSDVVDQVPIYDRLPVLRHLAATARRARNMLRG